MAEPARRRLAGTTVGRPSDRDPRAPLRADIPRTPRPIVRAHTRLARVAVSAPVPGTIPAARATGTSTVVVQPGPTTPPSFFPVAPQRDRPSGESLARAIGVTREFDGFGRSAVVFPQPPSGTTASGTNGRTIARETVELPTSRLNGSGPDGEPAETNTHDTGDFEELYDRVLSRLRRDLIVERERRGDLAGAYFQR